MLALSSLPVPGVGTVYINARPCYLTISENLQHHYSFDATGRFMTGFLDGANYRRGLDNTILCKQMTGPGTKTRRRLSDNENRAIIDHVQSRVAHIARHVAHSTRDEMLHRLHTILEWDYARLCHERTAFHHIYKPVSILPPDQYLSVVLQCAEGCSWNQCTFCSFYRDRPFHIKCPTEFQQHINQIKALLGQAIGLRKSIFLGDANALIIPQKRLIDLLQMVHEAFPIGTARPGDAYVLNGIYAFLDIFGAERKTLDEYRALSAHGMKRIYIGLETGDDELFALLNKPGSPRACVEAVQTIKQAGIAVGVIVLAGAGGDHFAAQHVLHTIARIREMRLGTEDIVYVSPLLVPGEDAYSQQIRARGGQPLTPAAVQQQVATFKTALRPRRTDSPKVCLYHIEEFIY